MYQVVHHLYPVRPAQALILVQVYHHFQVALVHHLYQVARVQVHSQAHRVQVVQYLAQAQAHHLFQAVYQELGNRFSRMTNGIH